jgi:hypothetical protein
VMFAMFAAWMIVVGFIFARPKWVPVATIASLVLTLILLRSHISDPIPLNF